MVCKGGCVCGRRLHTAKRELSSSTAPRWNVNERFCSHPVKCWPSSLVPEYLHFPSISSCPPPYSSGSQRLGGNIERAGLLRTATTMITILHHGVLINPVWPTEAIASSITLTETNRHLPASMASSTTPSLWEEAVRAARPIQTISPRTRTNSPVAPLKASLASQRWPSSRRPSHLTSGAKPPPAHFIVPASPSYFTATPRYTDGLLNLSVSSNTSFF